MVSRNPFRIRASEYIEEDEFLSLFGLNALDIFDADNIWTKIQIIRSARGGGKSSILRIFNPKSLNKIYQSRSHNEKFKSLYKRLKDLDVFNETGPKVLGIYLSLFGNYPILEQLNLDSRKRTKFFYALISSRIILAMLIGIVEFKKLEFPDELAKIYFKRPLEPSIPASLPLPCTGDRLWEWAVEIEDKVSNIIEDNASDEDKLGGFESLSILHVIKPKNIIFEDLPIAERSLLMLDDVDKLTSEQRIQLSEKLMNLRISPIWMAERLEALKPDELIFPDATSGREYDMPIILEKFWREVKNRSKFESLLSDIADKRASMNKQYKVNSFAEYLDEDLSKSWNKFQRAIDEESNRLTKKFGNITKYEFWFNKCNNGESVEKRAENWRSLEMLIERDIRKEQKTLFEEAPLLSNEFNLTSKETDVSEFYIRYKYEIPYYFGFQKLVKLASSNIQQFLNLSSDLFDEIISLKSFSKRDSVSAYRQEKLLSESVKNYWNEIRMIIPHSKYVISFLNSIGKFCFSETNFPAASYGPVTGIAISTKGVKTLRDKNVREINGRYKILSDVISTCLAYNLLEQLPDSKQGIKGTTHLILYLNRQLCLWYDLPLNYGGWREKKLDELCAYYEGKFLSRRKETLDFSSQRILGEHDAIR